MTASKFGVPSDIQGRPPQEPSVSTERPTRIETVPFQLARLPPELRVAIWEASLPEAQVHRVIVKGTAYSRLIAHIKPASLPITFQICSESRRAALARFKRFALDPQTDLTSPLVPYGYYDSRNDALYFPSNAINADIAFLSQPFHRIAISVDSHYGLNTYTPSLPRAVPALATRTNKLHICFVVTENISAPRGHNACDWVLPIEFPEPKQLTPSACSYFAQTTHWICQMEEYLGKEQRIKITVGDISLSCTCPGIFDETKRRLKLRRETEARRDRRRQERADRESRAQEVVERRRARKRHSDEQWALRYKAGKRLHGMTLRSRAK